jgi:CRP/FNR family transcriptional regulator, anaerobic regulatory protein
MYALNTAAGPAARLRPAVVPIMPQDTTLEGLFESQAAESFAAGTTVFWEGDPADDIFQLTQGILRLYRILPDGQRAIIGFIFAGEILGLSFKTNYLLTAEAITAVTVRRLSRTRFHTLVSESDALRPQLLARLCDEMCAVQDQVLVFLHRTADARVASFLLSVARKTTGGAATKGTEVELAMSRTDIADYLGLTIETVCRSIGKLKSEGLIVLNGPHKIVLQKTRVLRELAGEAKAGEAFTATACAA